MKSLALTLAFLLSIVSMSFASNDISSRDKNKKNKQVELKKNVDKQVNKHIFFPSTSSEKLNGSADVMFQIFPDGDVRVVLIQTKNPLIKKFIESQAKKMKVNKENVVIGEIFRYRFTFKSDDVTH